MTFLADQSLQIELGSPTDLLELYRRMLLLRHLDEELERLRAGGHVRGPMHVGYGQEATGIGAAAALRRGDVTTATHRPHAQYVGLGLPLGPTIAEMMGRADGQCGGRGGHMLISDRERGLLAPSGIIGHSLLLAVGHGYAQRLAGDGAVTLCVTGDGAVNSGAFNEAANMAALWRLPVIFLVENNGFALSIGLERHTHQTELFRRAAGYGIPAQRVDGTDPVQVRDAVEAAAARARDGGGPTLIEAVSYRIADFSSSDRGGYRSADEVEQAVDPLDQARERLLASGTDPEEIEAVERSARDDIAEAVRFAHASPQPDPSGLIEIARVWDGGVR